jgi:hypothetical protein
VLLALLLEQQEVLELETKVAEEAVEVTLVKAFLVLVVQVVQV